MRAFKYRLYPSQKQEVRWLTQFDLCRGLYNGLLQQCKTAYKIQGKALNKTELCKIITSTKQTKPELNGVYSQVLQSCADRLVKAYGSFFSRVRLRKQGVKVKAGFPRFKKYWRSITYPQFGFKLSKNSTAHRFLKSANSAEYQSTCIDQSKEKSKRSPLNAIAQGNGTPYSHVKP